jgi:outer membrane biosynthesis protein TonB
MHKRQRALPVLTAVVLGAHALALLGLPLWSQIPAPRTQVAAMQTRELSLPQPPAPPPAAPAAAAETPPPRPQPRPRPKVQRPAPAAPVAEPLDTPIRETVEPLPVASAPEPSTSDASVADAGTEQAAAPPAPAASPAPAAVAEPETPAAPPAGPAQGMAITSPDGTPLASDAPVPVQLPDPARLSFAVTGQAKRFNYSANAELAWRHANGQYQASQEVSLFLLGSRSQASEGRITAQGLEPRRFNDKARKEQSAQLDFDQRLAHFSAGAPDAAIAPGAQDRLSVFLQLSALLAAAPQRYPKGTQISFITVSARRADRWTFRVGDTETLDLPAGSTQALRLDKVAAAGDDQQASLWLAPSLQYLPVRIRLAQDNGDFADLQLKGRQAP